MTIKVRVRVISPTENKIRKEKVRTTMKWRMIKKQTYPALLEIPDKDNSK